MEPGVRIRPVTFAELADYMEGLANPAGRPPAPRARVVGITSSPSEFLDQHGRPGHSATGEYRRRRAADWQTWKSTITLRIAAVLTASVCVGLLTAAVAISSLAWFTGLIAAAALAWRLRFRPSVDTVAWRRGATGERRTARLLVPLERQGYQVSTTWPSLARPPTSTTWSSAPQGCWLSTPSATAGTCTTPPGGSGMANGRWTAP